MNKLDYTGDLNEFKSEPEVKLIFLDLETTGLDEPDIVELAYKVGNHKTRKFRFKPMKQIELGASKVHGIYMADVDTKPFFNDTIKQRLQKLLNNNILVAHNASFDVGVLRNHGVFTNRYICTKRLGQLLSKFDGVPFENHKLDTLSEYYKVNIERPIHDASTDVNILYEIYHNLVQRIEQIFGQSYTEVGLLFRLVHLSRIKFGKNSKYNAFTTPFDEVRNLTYKEFICNENVLRFGKYYGNSLFDLYNLQPGYLNWCRTNFKGEWKQKIEFLHRELDWIKEYAV